MLQLSGGMSGRSKRNVGQQPGKVALSGALAALAAAREGGTKRAATFEVKEEEALYDVVDDEQYQQLQAKQKIEAGEWLVVQGPNPGTMHGLQKWQGVGPGLGCEAAETLTPPVVCARRRLH